MLGAEQYWLIGLLASDGYKGKYNQIGINQSGEDGKKLIEYIKKLINANNPIRKIKTNRKDCFQLIVSSGKIVNELKKFNIVNAKTNIYDLPNIPQMHLNNFLAGYIEGDGCITVCDNGVGYKYLCASFVGTKEFICKCSELIPIKGNVRKHSMSDIYEIRWNGENAIKFCDWLYSFENLYHSYKYENYINAKNMFKNTRKERYKIIKNQVLNDFLSNKIDSIQDYANDINIPFQTIYLWKKKWESEGLL